MPHVFLKREALENERRDAYPLMFQMAYDLHGDRAVIIEHTRICSSSSRKELVLESGTCPERVGKVFL